MNNLVEIKKLVNGVEVANLTELAQMAGTTASTMLKWSAETSFPASLGEIKGSGRNGRSRLFPIADVMAWVKKHRNTKRSGNEWSSLFRKLSVISKTSPATYKIIIEMIDEASAK